MDLLSKGFIELFTEGWPLLLVGGLVYILFRRFVMEDRATHGPARGLFRPSGGFWGAGIVTIIAWDIVGPWWVAAALFVGLIAIGTEPKASKPLCVPLLAGWGFLVWQMIAPDTSVIGRIALLAIWLAVLAWVLRSLHGFRFVRRVFLLFPSLSFRNFGPSDGSRRAFVEKQVEEDPTNATAWLMRGVEMQRSGRQEDALDSYNRATNLAPENSDAWLLRGLNARTPSSGRSASFL